ncbi:MAG TPA: phosphate ABC transporter substrate-binding protein PstS [Rectinemataceae bacterium]|nr:phosphate ABC transporter substrate-binding protein PstS [Rectinemataceae bacterium]
MKKIVAVLALVALVAAATIAQAIPGSGLVTKGVSGEAKNLTGAGATFPAVLYTKWFSEYAAKIGVQVNYQAIGSGGGIKSISDMTVDFGASDGPMTDDQLAAAKGGHLLHIPMTMGAVVPTYNIPELSRSKQVLKFTADTLSAIYLGDIIKWNDPKLVADNPQLAKVDKYIVVVHRSDGSGTSNIWTSYLSAVSEKWAKTVGAGNSVQWPVGLGGKGNEGVAGNVKQTQYAIGYVEEAYAVQNTLPVAQVKNSAGTWMDPTAKAVSKAAEGVTLPDDLRVKMVNSSNPEAWPITGFTWILVYQQQNDPAKALALTRLLWWNLHDGQAYAEKLLYAPLPVDAIAKAVVLLKSVTVNGSQALPPELASFK